MNTWSVKTWNDWVELHPIANEYLEYLKENGYISTSQAGLLIKKILIDENSLQ